ncbi:MAG: LytTR family DNA-binding domain-containing protein [Terriglobales bacterium]
MPIRTLIADDEPLARERLRFLLADESDIDVVGECADGRSTVAFVENNAVDLLLLDIQMPEMDGFEVLKAIAPDRLPAVVFVTAYDRYALDAFEVHALDYLLKPVAGERIKAALDHVRAGQQTQLLSADIQRRLANLLTEHELRGRRNERISVKSDGEITFLAAEEIDWIESAGNYVTLHIGNKTKFLRETLSAMEKKLASHGFVRISRSTVVNTAKIKAMRSSQYGDYKIQLLDATELTLSRGYRESFFELVDLP